MEWRKLPQFPDYEFSERGDVRRLTQGGRRYPAGYVLTAKAHPRGYLCYMLNDESGKALTMLAHRLVAMAFLPEPLPGQSEVAHGDGTRTNNDWRNLRWATPKDNQADRKLHGTYVKGEAAYSAKISAAQVNDIRKRYANGGKRYIGGSVTYRTLAAEFGISQAQVSRIVNNGQWN
jgi:HNH endonuclease